MNTLLRKEQLSANVYKLVVEAPLIARARRAGHFVIVRADNHGERIPLTIAEADTKAGTITLIVQAVGLSSKKLCRLEEGDEFADIVGPLGKATHIENFGTVVCAGGGVGVAPMLPIVQALKAAGNRVIVVLAARSKELVILEEEMRAASHEVIIMTDDGSAGTKGMVTDGIRSVLEREPVHRCFAIGPAIMMKFCCLLTKEYNVPTDVSLNTIMVDGTGMCGACRITVGGQRKFVCVDGPEFDGHAVDFDEMLMRLRAYKGAENEKLHHHEEIEAHLDKSRDATWRTNLRKAKSAKERIAIPRCEMEELDPVYRATQLRAEVNRGLSPAVAQMEAQRCLDCNNPGCVQGCPVGIDIPRFIKHVELGEFAEAAHTIKEYSTLPAVCGRVCPQEKQCESRCIHLKTKGESVAIGHLERFVADYERQQGTATVSHRQRNGKRVAVVGSGPAGLAFAGEMLQRGYDVTVFEALHEFGGVLKYGIPEYRLPNEIVDYEINALRQAGVQFVKDCVIGQTVTVEQLKEDGYCGLFAGPGAGLPNFMGIPGENSINILSSNEYLTRVNLMEAFNEASDTPVPRGKHVIVVGGGNTAMDSVRTAKRLGAETATIVYRRSEEEMPARLEEVRHAKEEGIDFLTLHNPLSYIADENGCVKQVVLQKMALGEPDDSGRRSPIALEGKTVVVDTDMVIVSVGVSPNPLFTNSLPELQLGRRGVIAVNDQLQSSDPMIFAGGDIVRGGATVILAMGDGKQAAANMDAQLQAQA